MALLADGSICCWRHSKFPSDDKFDTSRAPQSKCLFVDIAVGSEHCVALQDDGTVVTWGDNRAGQCDVKVGPMRARAVAASGNWTAVQLDSGEVTVSGWGCHFLPWDIGKISTRKLLLDHSNRLTAECIDGLFARNPTVCIKQVSGSGIRCYLLDTNQLVVARDCLFGQPTINQLVDLRTIPFVKDFGIGADFAAVLFESGQVVSFRVNGESDVQIAPSALIPEEVEDIHVLRGGLWARTKSSSLHIWGRIRNLRRCPWEASPKTWANFITAYGHSVALSTLPPDIAQHELVAPLLK
jgi:hypothetical protein